MILNPFSSFLSSSPESLFFSNSGSMNYGHCNPHGIDTILNRRTAAAAQAALNSLSTAAVSSCNNSASSNTENTTPASTVNPYFKLEDFQAAAQAAAQVAQQQRPNSAASNLYWPGIQGLISNPNLWRDRFNGKNQYTFILMKSLSPRRH